MVRLRSATPPRRERFNEPSPASGSGRPFRRGRSRVAEPSSLPLRICTRDVLPMNGLSKGSMPTPERDDRTASRSGFQSEDGITVAFSSPPAMSASRDMPSGKTVSPARTLRKANGSEAFGGCTVRSAMSSAGGKKDISGRLMLTCTPGRRPHHWRRPTTPSSRMYSTPRNRPYSSRPNRR